MGNAFDRAADRTNALLGSGSAMILSVIVVGVWAVSGPAIRLEGATSRRRMGPAT